jgi:hypothetical protein
MIPRPITAILAFVISSKRGSFGDEEDVEQTSSELQAHFRSNYTHE